MTEPKRPRGRPPRINQPHPDEPESTIGEVIPRDIAAGLFKRHAAGRAGVAEQSLGNWLERGAQQLSRLHGFESENPGALDCDHAWGRQKQPRCTACDVSRAAWDDLIATDDREGVYVDFFEAVTRAVSTAIASLVADVRAAVRPRAAEVLYGRDGEPLIHNGRVQTARPDRGDWRAGAWLVERMDPTHYHLPTKVEVGGDPDGEPIRVSMLDELNAELDELAANLSAADAARERTVRGGQDAQSG